jgi:hypothetical protein
MTSVQESKSWANYRLQDGGKSDKEKNATHRIYVGWLCLGHLTGYFISS